jgi:hypothetical protein
VVLVAAEEECSPEECILVALTVGAAADHIGFARIVSGLEEERLSGVHTGLGRIGSVLGVEMWLEGMRWDCRNFVVEEALGLAFARKDPVVIVLVGNRNLRCERKQDVRIVDVLIEVAASLGLDTGRQNL